MIHDARVIQFAVRVVLGAGDVVFGIRLVFRPGPGRVVGSQLVAGRLPFARRRRLIELLQAGKPALDLLTKKLGDFGQIGMRVALVEPKSTNAQTARSFAKIEPHPARRRLRQAQDLEGAQIIPLERFRERTLRTLARYFDRETPERATDTHFDAIERPYAAQIGGEHPPLPQARKGDSALAYRPVAQEIARLALAGQSRLGGDTRSELG